MEEEGVLLGVNFEIILCMEKVPVSTQGSIPWSRQKECFLYLLIPLGYQRLSNMLHGKVKQTELSQQQRMIADNHISFHIHQSDLRIEFKGS